MLTFVIVVVSTPITAWQLFPLYLALLVGFAVQSKIPLRTFFLRALIEVPFVLFAVLMPFFGHGKQVTFGPFTLYEAGLLAGTSILVKGTLGVLAAVLLSTTTTARELLRGFEKLRMPSLMVQIASFMLRYVNVVNDELDRMKVARDSRGFEATSMKQWRVLASAAGALFIRSYERGERVHLAMLSRGYTGELPRILEYSVTPRTWLQTLALPTLAAVISIGRFL